MATDNPILARTQASSQPTEDDLAYEAAQRAKSSAAPKIDPQLQAIEEALASNNARNATNTAMLEQSADQVNTATSIIKNSMSEIAASTQIVSAATMNADLTAQNNANAILAAAGGTEEQVKNMTRLKEQGDKLNDLQARRADIMDDDITGLSIIDSIINGFRSIGESEDIYYAEQQYNSTIMNIQNQTSAQEGFYRINSFNKKSINDATIAANHKQIAAQASMQAAQQDIANVQSNADMMNRIALADTRTTSNLLESYRLSGTAEQRVASAERLQFDRESMANQREMWEFDKPRMAAQMEAAQLALEDTKAATPAKRATYAQTIKTYEEGLAFEEQVNTSVRKAQSALGLQPEAPEQIQFKLSNPSTRDRYIKLSEIGASGDARSITYGSDPYEAYATARSVDPDGRAAETKGTELLDTISRAQMENYKALQTNPPKDDATYRADYNKAAAALMTASAKNIVAGDTTNPYQAPPMSVLENYAIVQNSPLWKNVLGKVGMVETNPQRIVETAAAGVVAKLISPEEAASGITAIFQAATMFNNEQSGGFRRVGLEEYEQRSYNTLLKYKPTFYESLLDSNLSIGVNPLLQAGYAQLGSQSAISFKYEPAVKSEVINLLDKASVQQAIIKQLNATPPIDSAANQPK